MLGLLRSRKVVKPPRLPEGIRIYALGDIHGRADLLTDMFTLIDTDSARSPANRVFEVYLGDYIDRGPYSSYTLDLLIERSFKRETAFLKGNHEAHFLEVVLESAKIDDWLLFGGLQTLMSYGIQPTINPSTAEQTDLILSTNPMKQTLR